MEQNLVWKGKLTLSNAGKRPVLWFRKDAAEALKLPALPKSIPLAVEIYVWGDGHFKICCEGNLEEI